MIVSVMTLCGCAPNRDQAQDFNKTVNNKHTISSVPKVGATAPLELDLGQIAGAKHTLRFISFDNATELQILKNNSAIYREKRPAGDKGYSVVSCSFNDSQIVPSVSDAQQNNEDEKPQVVDLNGDGTPDAVIEEASKEGTYRYLILSLGGSVKKVAEINGGYSRIKMVRHDDKKYRLQGHDWYDTWGAKAPAPDIVLCFEGEKCILDIAKMRRSPPNKDRLKNMIREARGAFRDYAPGSIDDPLIMVPPEVSDVLLSLIYSGNGDKAKQVLDKSWTTRRSGREEFWKALMKQLSNRPYGRQLKDWNRWQ